MEADNVPLAAPPAGVRAPMMGAPLKEPSVLRTKIIPAILLIGLFFVLWYLARFALPLLSDSLKKGKRKKDKASKEKEKKSKRKERETDKEKRKRKEKENRTREREKGKRNDEKR